MILKNLITFILRTSCEHFFIPSQKVRRNPFSAPFSLKINAAFSITQHGGSGACGGMAEKFPPLPPHVVFIFYVRFLRFAVFRRDTEPLPKGRLNTSKKSMLLFYFPLNCFSHINKKNNTLLLEQIVLKDLVPLSLPYFLAALKSFLRNAIFISCVLIHLPPSS